MSGAAIPGRTSITRRALSSVLAAVAAEQLGVRSGSVRIDLSDDATLLGVRVTSSAGVGRRGDSLRDTGAAVREAVASDGARLTGAQIGRVTVRITGQDSDTRRAR